MPGKLIRLRNAYAPKPAKRDNTIWKIAWWLSIYTAGLLVGFWHGRSKCVETCEFRLPGAHYEYTAPVDFIPVFEDDALNTELVLRTSMCQNNSRCHKLYPMSEDLFAALQIAAYEAGTVVTRQVVP